MIAHINIGSNIGDSRSVIERAVAAVFALSEGSTRRSAYIESEPWGFESPNMFLNIGVEIESTLPPLVLLAKLQEIEKSISPASHRNPDGSYRDRVIDLDLIFYGDIELHTPRLTLPHPHAPERPFVIQPIRELHPAAPFCPAFLASWLK